MNIFSEKRGGVVKRTLNHYPQVKSRVFSHHGFVVHRHNGGIVHYHLRLEVNGVVKSWLVPNGPSLNPRDRRLAIMVTDTKADHPHGQIWDKGNYASVGGAVGDDSLQRQINEGNVKFVLNGKKLKGSFRLLQMKDRGDNLWLLIKGNDQYSVDYPYNAEDFAKGNTPTWQSRYARE